MLFLYLAPGETETDIDAGLVENPPSLGDTVFVDKNGNGVYDAGDEAKAGVTVNLYQCDDTQPGSKGAFVTSDVTDATGNYLFTGLVPGEYVVEFILPNGYSFTSQSAVAADVANNASDAGLGGLTGCIDLAPGETETDIDAGLVELASLGD